VTAYRLVHGAADGAPGLAVDRYADVAVIHADSTSVLEAWLPTLRAEIQPLCPTAYVKIHARGGPNQAPEEPVWGTPRHEVEVSEHGARYAVRPASGLSVGLFLDMREVRLWLREYSMEKTVLNLFAYTCSLGVCAALGSARRVVNLDLSRPYLEWGKANYGLNGLPVDQHDFIYGDAFDWLGRFARREERFDVVIVDPPSFSSTPFSVTRDYARLIGSAARVVAPGGALLAATNHAATSPRRFEAWLSDGLRAADRRAVTLERWSEPREDFPVGTGQRPYLKVRALQLD
jgi:23S rRNA (cytosine1962-C5)-methyltransferase